MALSQLYGIGNSLTNHNCKSIHCLCAFTYFGFVYQTIPRWVLYQLFLAATFTLVSTEKPFTQQPTK